VADREKTAYAFETLGRNVMLAWGQLNLRTPVAIAATTAVNCVRATGVETIRLEPNFNTLQRHTSFGAKRGIKFGNRRNVYG